MITVYKLWQIAQPSDLMQTNVDETSWTIAEKLVWIYRQEQATFSSRRGKKKIDVLFHRAYLFFDCLRANL